MSVSNMCHHVGTFNTNKLSITKDTYKLTSTSILCPRLGAEGIGRISWLPRAPLGPPDLPGRYDGQVYGTTHVLGTLTLNTGYMQI